MKQLAASLLLLALAAPALAADPVSTIRNADPKADDWDNTVTMALVAAFDRDGSMAIDSSKELKAIGCSVWQAIDAGVQAAWDGTGVRCIYGFGKGYGWVGYALGIDEKLRKSADKAMAKCGLQV